MEIRSTKFRVGHEWRVGGLFRPAGGGTGAAVLMLHGFPGVVKNEDIAAELCRRGMTVLLPNFGGCWGSHGRFSVRGLLDDGWAAFRLIRRYPGVDPERVGLLGYSVGGWAALKLAGRMPVAAAAALAPAIPRGELGADARYLRRHARVVNAPRLDELWREYVEECREDRPEIYLARISPKPLLVVQGLRDALVPAASTASLMAHARKPKTYLELPGEDHEFQNDRGLVVGSVCDWLDARLRPRAAAGTIRRAAPDAG
jgi:dienelactone hydrolase